MQNLEKGLHAHFAQLQQAQASATTNGTSATSAAPSSTLTNGSTDAGALETPFAKVNSVESGSPADQAGLKAGDMVRNFGSAHWLNHERLSKVAQVVQENEGVCCTHFLCCLLLHEIDTNVFESVEVGFGQGIAQGGEWIADYRTGAAAHPSTELGRSGASRMSFSSFVKRLVLLIKIADMTVDVICPWRMLLVHAAL